MKRVSFDFGVLVCAGMIPGAQLPGKQARMDVGAASVHGKAACSVGYECGSAIKQGQQSGALPAGLT
jgi:hypothetical protein